MTTRIYLKIYSSDTTHQVAGVGEALPAARAGVRALAGVRAQVPAQVGGGARAEPAAPAAVRLLARVEPHVHLQVTCYKTEDTLYS